jgi:hypothetical protein
MRQAVGNAFEIGRINNHRQYRHHEHFFLPGLCVAESVFSFSVSVAGGSGVVRSAFSSFFVSDFFMFVKGQFLSLS